MANLLKGVAFITGAGSGEHEYHTGVAQPLTSFQGLDNIQLTPLQDMAALDIAMDVSKEESVQSGSDKIVQNFGRIDIAVNNAGIGGAGKQTADQDLKDWQKVFDINVNGVFLCQRGQIRQMLKQEPLDPLPRGSRGVIVNTASMLGLVASSPQSAAGPYTASKHAVMGLTKTDAITYAEQGIRINAI